MTLFLIITYAVLVILAIAICRVSADEEFDEYEERKSQRKNSIDD